MILSPSLLSADFAHLDLELESLAKAGLQWVHLDIMDGHFVPNITFGPPVLHSLRKQSQLFFDTHLMIADPGRFIDAFVQAGADLLVIHAESDLHLQRTLNTIRTKGLKAGLAFNPATDFSCLRWLAPDLDLILLMSVNPGFSGQTFLPQTYNKIRACRDLLTEIGYAHLPIQIDGGVCPENTAALLDAGADILVSGSSFFGYKPYQQRLEKFFEATKGHGRKGQNLFWQHGN